MPSLTIRLPGGAALWCTLAALAFGQPSTLRVERVAAGDPRADLMTMALVRDEVGFLWFGTQRGVHRYDGVRIQSFDGPPDAPRTADPYINALAEDALRPGRIWAGTFEGGSWATSPSPKHRSGSIRSPRPSEGMRFGRCCRIAGACCGSGRTAAG